MWVSGILAVLRVLVSQSTEDIVLSRVHELSLSPHLLSCHTLASQYEGVLSGPSRSQGKALRLGSSSLRPGLYHYCFMAPYTHFTQALADASLRNMVQAEQEQDTSGWFDVMQKASNQLRSNIANATRNRGDKNAIHNHIRLFEPLVIKALKQYTTSTSVALQRQVLDLLAQLVQLRVNYCLLDSDQVKETKRTRRALS